MNDRSTVASRINPLADAIVAAMPRLDTVERDVAIALYRALAKGRPVQPEEVAGRVRIDAARATAMRSRDQLGAVRAHAALSADDVVVQSLNAPYPHPHPACGLTGSSPGAENRERCPSSADRSVRF